MILDLLLLTIIVCFIVDISGIITTIKKFIVKYIYKLPITNLDKISIKPLECSLCMTFWTTLIYIIIQGELTIVNLTLVTFFSLISSNISGYLLLIKDVLAKIENFVINKLQ